MCNTIGYVSNNVVPCCMRCNRVKGDHFTYTEMLEFAVTIRGIDSKREENNE